MSYSKFIISLLLLYITYYALNFIYDGFFKKSHKVSDEGEEAISFNLEDVSEVQTINLDEEEDSNSDFEAAKNDSNSILEEAEEKLKIEVETQGVAFSDFVTGHKDMFSSVPY